MPKRLITQITLDNDREALEKNGERWASITQGINHHRRVVRTVKLRDFITMHSENWLSYFRTPAGDECRVDNAHLLSLLASAPRAQLVTQLVSMGCRKKKEVKKSPRYGHFVTTGDSTIPKEVESNRDRDRSRRPIISTVDLTDESGPSTGRRNDYQGNNR